MSNGSEVVIYLSFLHSEFFSCCNSKQTYGYYAICCCAVSCHSLCSWFKIIITESSVANQGSWYQDAKKKRKWIHPLHIAAFRLILLLFDLNSMTGGTWNISAFFTILLLFVVDFRWTDISNSRKKPAGLYF